MGGSPIAIVIVVISANLFAAVVQGDSLIDEVWPVGDFVEGDDYIDVSPLAFSNCDSDVNNSSGFFAGVADAVCFVGNIFKGLANAVIFVINVVGDIAAGIVNTVTVTIAVFQLLISFFTWEIQGLPTLGRVILSSITGLALTYSLFDMMRGRG